MMREDNDRAGFPFSPSEFWRNEASNFDTVFESAGINSVEDEYFNTRFHGIERNDPRLYEWFVSVFWRYLRERDRLGLLQRLDSTLNLRSKYFFLVNGERIEFGPPVWVENRQVSPDLLFSIYDFYNLLELNPALATEPLIVGDLGAGWGRIGYVLLHANPRAHYVIFDIPESLLISSTYLPGHFPEHSSSGYDESKRIGKLDRDRLLTKSMWFLGAQDLARLPAHGVDFMVNVASFQEMNAAQVNRYIELFDEVAFGGHVYLRNGWVGVSSSFAEYSIPVEWIVRFRRNTAFSAGHVEAGYRVT